MKHNCHFSKLRNSKLHGYIFHVTFMHLPYLLCLHGKVFMLEVNWQTAKKRKHSWLACFSGFTEPQTMFKAFNFVLAFLHMLPIWYLKFSFESVLVHYSFSELLLCTCAVVMFTRTFSLADNKTGHLPSLSFHVFVTEPLK